MPPLPLPAALRETPRSNHSYFLTFLNYSDYLFLGFGLIEILRQPAHRGHHRTKPYSDPNVTRHEIHTPNVATDIAILVRDAIKHARNQFPDIKTTHLFLAIPVGLAMMIGQLLNTCGLIQTYEYQPDNHECPYQPVIMLNSSW